MYQAITDEKQTCDVSYMTLECRANFEFVCWLIEFPYFYNTLSTSSYSICYTINNREEERTYGQRVSVRMFI